MKVLFLNENTLGHASYLVPLVEHFEKHSVLRIEPILRNATPLPPNLDKWASFSIRGVRKFGLDFHAARWRRTVSRHACGILREIRQSNELGGIVVNTQSIGLSLFEHKGSVPLYVPLYVCLDATFRQLSRSAWFAPNPVAKAFLPITLAPIMRKERDLFGSAKLLFPWSEVARKSLSEDYGISDNRLHVLPPSISIPPSRTVAPLKNKPLRVLFLGGDFHRKGGQLVLNTIRKYFSSSMVLDIVTQTNLPSEPGVGIHHGVKPWSDRWLKLWSNADVFVFPSSLETFGIVLLEAMAFEVPIISSKAGAACEILDHGKGGILLDTLTESTLKAALESLLANQSETLCRMRWSRQKAETVYNIQMQATTLAGILHQQNQITRK